MDLPAWYNPVLNALGSILGDPTHPEKRQTLRDLADMYEVTENNSYKKGEHYKFLIEALKILERTKKSSYIYNKMWDFRNMYWHTYDIMLLEVDLDAYWKTNFLHTLSWDVDQCIKRPVFFAL